MSTGKPENLANDSRSSFVLRLDDDIEPILAEWANQFNSEQGRARSSRYTERKVNEVILRWLKKQEIKGDFKPNEILGSE
jgi:hypothetical protein